MGQTMSPNREGTQMAASYENHNFVPLADVVISSITSEGQHSGLASDAIHVQHDIQQEEYRM